MSNRHDISDEQVFEDLVASDQEIPSNQMNSSKKVNPSTITANKSKIISCQYLQAFEIKIDEAKEKNQTLLRELDYMQRSTSEDIERLRTSKNQSSRLDPFVTPGDSATPSTAIKQSLIRKTSEKQSSINMEVESNDSKIEPRDIRQTSSEILFGKDKVCQQCDQNQWKVAFLQKELEDLKKYLKQGENNQIQKENIIENLKKQLRTMTDQLKSKTKKIEELTNLLEKSEEKIKYWEAEKGVMQENSGSYFTSFNQNDAKNENYMFKYTGSGYIEVNEKKVNEFRKVTESYVIDSKAPQNPTSDDTRKFEQQIKDYQQKIQELSFKLENALSELSNKKLDSQNQIKKLIIANQELNTRNIQFSTTYTKDKQTIILLEKDIQILQKEISNLQHEISEKNAQMKEKNRLIKEKDQIIKNHQEKQQLIREKDDLIKNKNIQIQRQTQEILRFNQIREKEKEELTNTTLKIHELNQTITTLQEQISVKTDLLNKKDLQLRLKEEQIQKQKEELKLKTEYIQKKEQEMAEMNLQDDRAQIEKELREKFNLKVSQLMSQMKGLSEEKEKLMSQMKVLSEEKERMSVDIRALIEEKQELNSEVIHKSLDYGELYEKYEKVKNDLMEEKTETASKIKALKHRNQMMEQQIQDLKENLINIQEQNLQNKTDLNNSRMDETEQLLLQVKNLSQENSSLKVSLKKEQEFKERLNEEVKNLKRQNAWLTEYESKISILQGSLTALEDQITKLVQQIKLKDQEAEALKAKIHETQNELDDLKLVNQSLTRMIKEMKMEHESLESKDFLISELQEKIDLIQNPKTITEKFDVIKNWFGLKQSERMYEYQSRPAQRIRENIQLMNWLEEYFRMIVSETIIAGQEGI